MIEWLCRCECVCGGACVCGACIMCVGVCGSVWECVGSGLYHEATISLAGDEEGLLPFGWRRRWGRGWGRR